MLGTLGSLIFGGGDAGTETFEFGAKRAATLSHDGIHPNGHSRSILQKILLIDDDPTYGLIMKRAAALRGIDIVFCSNLDDVAKYANQRFDMALIDFNLGPVTGIEFSEYMTRYDFGDINTVIISQTQQRVSYDWPQNSRHFVHKDKGIQSVIDYAMAVFEGA